MPELLRELEPALTALQAIGYLQEEAAAPLLLVCDEAAPA